MTRTLVHPLAVFDSATASSSLACSRKYPRFTLLSTGSTLNTTSNLVYLGQKRPQSTSQGRILGRPRFLPGFLSSRAIFLEFPDPGGNMSPWFKSSMSSKGSSGKYAEGGGRRLDVDGLPWLFRGILWRLSGC